jgi:molybdenum cofactor guanylyltransferase
MAVQSSIPAAIMAGGHGRRIGGQKSAKLLAHKSLLDHALNYAARTSALVAVAADTEDSGPLPQNVSLILDDIIGAGPISGLSSALRFANEQRATHILVIACDVPFLPQNLLPRLQHVIGDAAMAMAISDGKLHPACALWRADCAKLLPEYLATGRRSLMGFAETAGYETVHWPCVPFDPFFNINTAENLAEAEKIAPQFLKVL